MHTHSEACGEGFQEPFGKHSRGQNQNLQTPLKRFCMCSCLQLNDFKLQKTSRFKLRASSFSALGLNSGCRFGLTDIWSLMLTLNSNFQFLISIRPRSNRNEPETNTKKNKTGQNLKIYWKNISKLGSKRVKRTRAGFQKSRIFFVDGRRNPSLFVDRRPQRSHFGVLLVDRRRKVSEIVDQSSTVDCKLVDGRPNIRLFGGRATTYSAFLETIRLFWKPVFKKAEFPFKKAESIRLFWN